MIPPVYSKGPGSVGFFLKKLNLSGLTRLFVASLGIPNEALSITFKVFYIELTVLITSKLFLLKDYPLIFTDYFFKLFYAIGL